MPAATSDSRRPDDRRQAGPPRRAAGAASDPLPRTSSRWPRALRQSSITSRDRRARPRRRHSDTHVDRRRERVAADVPRPSLDREVALALRRRHRDGFHVPSPRRAVVTRRLTRSNHGGRGRSTDHRAGEVSTTELFTACRRAPRPTPTCTTPPPGSRTATPDRAAGRAVQLGGLPLAVKDLFCTEGVPSQSGSTLLEGYRPPYTATAVRASSDVGAPHATARQTRTSSRWAAQRELAPSVAVRTRGTPRRVPGGSVGGSAAAVAAGLAPWALGTDTAARSASRPRSAASSGLKPTYGSISPLRDDRVRLLPRPAGADRALGRTDAALLLRSWLAPPPP